MVETCSKTDIKNLEQTLERTVEIIEAFTNYFGITMRDEDYRFACPFHIYTALDDVYEGDARLIEPFLKTIKEGKSVSDSNPLTRLQIFGNKNTKNKEELYLFENILFAPLKTKLSDNRIDRLEDYSIKDRKILKSIITENKEFSPSITFKFQKHEDGYWLHGCHFSSWYDPIDIPEHVSSDKHKYPSIKKAVFIGGEIGEDGFKENLLEPIVLAQAIIRTAKPIFRFQNYARDVVNERKQEAERYINQQ
jgi:hypothetical protein